MSLVYNTKLKNIRLMAGNLNFYLLGAVSEWQRQGESLSSVILTHQFQGLGPMACFIPITPLNSNLVNPPFCWTFNTSLYQWPT
jgi:hypothetical protein